MLFYLICFGCSCVLLYQGSKNKVKWNLPSIMGLLIPTLLAAFRSNDVGTDTAMYHTMYKLATDSGKGFIEYLITDSEIYFYLIANLSKYIGGIWFVFFTYQAVNLLCIYYISWHFRKRIAIWLVFWLYFCLLFPYSLNIMRQITAVCYILYLTIFLIENQKRKFYIGALLSIGFHASAVIGAFFVWIIFYLTSLNKNKRYIMFILFTCLIGFIYGFYLKLTPFLGILGIEKFNGYAEGYGQLSNSSYISITDLTFRLFIIMVIWFTSVTKIIKSHVTYLYALIITGELGFMMLGLYNGFLFRVALYLTVFHLFLLPFISESKNLTEYSRRIVKSIIVIMGLVYWYWVFANNGTCETIPYKSII